MVRKTEDILSNKYKKLKEFRGIPINYDIKSSKTNWVYGTPKVIDEYEIRVQYDPKNPIPRRAYITFYDEKSNGMSMYCDVEVHLSSLGQKIGYGIFEGDLLTHKKYPGCLFELQWVQRLSQWKIKLVYGSDGLVFKKNFPNDIREYGTDSHIWCGNQPWYPIDFRYSSDMFPELDNSVFIGTDNNYIDIWFDSKSGNSGDVWLLGPTLKPETVNVNGVKQIMLKPVYSEMKLNKLGDIGDLCITYPAVWEQFLKRKLVKI